MKGYVVSTSTLLWLPLQLYKWLVVIPVMLLSTFLVCSLIIMFSAVGMQDFSSRVLASIWARLNMLFTLMTIEIDGREKITTGQS
ncbi:MAG: hypothetical protein O6945_15405 [Gammaproteobacteria bacterium]|nr:hypothetical protein [Gammaproteobacteria bacterium]